MEYTIIQRDVQAFQQPVSVKHIETMRQRAFGPGVLILSVRELGSGQFNNTYLLDLAGRDPVVLRVAPSPERTVFWHERFLMRRELAMQPLLVPIVPLLPTILMRDCSTRSSIETISFNAGSQAHCGGTSRQSWPQRSAMSYGANLVIRCRSRKRIDVPAD